MYAEHSPIAFLDHVGVEWSRVRSSRFWMEQRFRYSYPGRIRELRQRLIVFPSDQYGDQRVREYALHVSAPEAVTQVQHDRFGNRVVHVYVPEAEGEVTFEMRLEVERVLDGAEATRLSAAETATYREPSELTAYHPRLAAISGLMQAQYADPEERCEAISQWVFRAMRYGAGATTVSTTAAEALAIGQGLCQDYAHIMIALCRGAGIAARYSSGHMLGEGGSHAWVETLLPDGQGAYRPVAFDPTNNRRTTPAYITVAVGRDYNDVAPTSGSYVAPFAGHLTASKRAGLTYVAYRG
jgi:transglutaminase-like putative cysteine protease